MPRVESFAPLVGKDPKILILGSMPGVKSLEAQQYYAHPRNGFWPIMAELFAVTWHESYPERVKQLQQLPLVLWDVLGSCDRQGSLDADIRADQLEVNAIDRLLQQHANISHIAFNGATAEKYFCQRVAKQVPNIERLKLRRLPSTSPANAGMTRQQKLDAWRVILL